MVEGKTETVITTNDAARATMEKKGEDTHAVADELIRHRQVKARQERLNAAFEDEAA